MQNVRTASRDDAAMVNSLVILAFAADPFARWVFGNGRDYLDISPAFIEAFGGRGYDHGTVHIDESGRGAGMWLPPGIGPDEERMAAILAEHVRPELAADVFGVVEQMGASHPTEPHWYLPILAVDPVAQGNGIGTALLSHALKTCDAEGQQAYLESSNPRNIGLYQRQGFEIVGEIQVGSSPPIIPMVRHPRSPR